VSSRVGWETLFYQKLGLNQEVISLVSRGLYMRASCSRDAGQLLFYLFFIMRGCAAVFVLVTVCRPKRHKCVDVARVVSGFVGRCRNSQTDCTILQWRCSRWKHLPERTPVHYTEGRHDVAAPFVFLPLIVVAHESAFCLVKSSLGLGSGISSGSRPFGWQNVRTKGGFLMSWRINCVILSILSFSTSRSFTLRSFDL